MTYTKSLQLSPFVFLILTVFTFCFFVTEPAHASTTLFSDGFESGNLGNWSVPGSTHWSVINNAGGAHAGSKRAKVTGATPDDYLSHAVSTVGYDTITVSYWYDTDTSKGIEPTDDFRIEWSVDGTNWSVVAGSDIGTLNNNTYQQNSFTLPVGANDNASFSFRFLANFSAVSSDTFNIEDVVLEGTAISAPAVTHTLAYTAGANGSIAGTVSQTVNDGASGASVTAVANADFHFLNWSDASTDNPRTDRTITGDIAVTANFEADVPPPDPTPAVAIVDTTPPATTPPFHSTGGHSGRHRPHRKTVTVLVQTSPTAEETVAATLVTPTNSGIKEQINALRKQVVGLLYQLVASLQTQLDTNA